MSNTFMTAPSLLFTSESVTEGHPDKICDQISDAVLDAVLAEDPRGRVACEAMVKDRAVYVAGEITARATPDIPKLVRDTIHGIGYTDPGGGFTAEGCQLEVNLTQQSADIDMGVGTGGAGDQGIMFGYACNETDELMPFPIMMAHKLCLRLAEVRHRGTLDFVRPDGKSQVTVEYDGSRPQRVDAVVISTQHADSVTNETLREGILQCVIKPVLPAHMPARTPTNPTIPPGGLGRGGPGGDRGLRDGRSSWTRTEARRTTVAAPSLGRIPPRSTVQRRTWPATSPRISWRLDSPNGWRCNSLTLSASPIPFRSWWIPLARDV